MRNAITNTRRPAHYTVREAAWILGTQPSTISRTIRLGTLRTVRRHGRLVVPASALTRLLGERTDDHEVDTAKPHTQRSQAAKHSPQSGGTTW